MLGLPSSSLVLYSTVLLMISYSMCAAGLSVSVIPIYLARIDRYASCRFSIGSRCGTTYYFQYHNFDEEQTQNPELLCILLSLEGCQEAMNVCEMLHALLS